MAKTVDRQENHENVNGDRLAGVEDITLLRNVDREDPLAPGGVRFTDRVTARDVSEAGRVIRKFTRNGLRDLLDEDYLNYGVGLIPEVGSGDQEAVAGHETLEGVLRNAFSARLAFDSVKVVAIVAESMAEHRDSWKEIEAAYNAAMCCFWKAGEAAARGEIEWALGRIPGQYRDVDQVRELRSRAGSEVDYYLFQLMQELDDQPDDGVDEESLLRYELSKGTAQLAETGVVEPETISEAAESIWQCALVMEDLAGREIRGDSEWAWSVKSGDLLAAAGVLGELGAWNDVGADRIVAGLIEKVSWKLDNAEGLEDSIRQGVEHQHTFNEVMRSYDFDWTDPGGTMIEGEAYYNAAMILEYGLEESLAHAVASGDEEACLAAIQALVCDEFIQTVGPDRYTYPYTWANFVSADDLEDIHRVVDPGDSPELVREKLLESAVDVCSVVEDDRVRKEVEYALDHEADGNYLLKQLGIGDHAQSWLIEALYNATLLAHHGGLDRLLEISSDVTVDTVSVIEQNMVRMIGPGSEPIGSGRMKVAVGEQEENAWKRRLLPTDVARLVTVEKDLEGDPVKELEDILGTYWENPSWAIEAELDSDGAGIHGVTSRLRSESGDSDFNFNHEQYQRASALLDVAMADRLGILPRMIEVRDSIELSGLDLKTELRRSANMAYCLGETEMPGVGIPSGGLFAAGVREINKAAQPNQTKEDNIMARLDETKENSPEQVDRLTTLKGETRKDLREAPIYNRLAKKVTQVIHSQFHPEEAEALQERLDDKTVPTPTVVEIAQLATDIDGKGTSIVANKKSFEALLVGAVTDMMPFDVFADAVAKQGIYDREAFEGLRDDFDMAKLARGHAERSQAAYDAFEASMVPKVERAIRTAKYEGTQEEVVSGIKNAGYRPAGVAEDLVKLCAEECRDFTTLFNTLKEFGDFHDARGRKTDRVNNFSEMAIPYSKLVARSIGLDVGDKEKASWADGKTTEEILRTVGPMIEPAGLTDDGFTKFKEALQGHIDADHGPRESLDALRKDGFTIPHLSKAQYLQVSQGWAEMTDTSQWSKKTPEKAHDPRDFVETMATHAKDQEGMAAIILNGIVEGQTFDEVVEAARAGLKNGMEGMKANAKNSARRGYSDFSAVFNKAKIDKMAELQVSKSEDLSRDDIEAVLETANQSWAEKVGGGKSAVAAGLTA